MLNNNMSVRRKFLRVRSLSLCARAHAHSLEKTLVSSLPPGQGNLVNQYVITVSLSKRQEPAIMIKKTTFH